MTHLTEITMLDLFSQFATDESKEIDGTIQEIAGVNFTIARAGNRHYGKLLTKLVNKNQRILDGKDDAADAKSDEIMCEVIANTILRGWEGEIVVEQGGDPVSYSVDAAKKALKLKDFRAEVMRAAGDTEAYRVAKVEEAEKN
jgi:hypothetical protein